MAKLTKNQQRYVDKVKAVLSIYKEENKDASFITLTTLKKKSGLGKGRLYNTIRLGNIAMTIETVPNFNKEGVESGEVKQYQISL